MPFNSPREVDEIVESVIETTRDINPAVDIRKGPLAVLMWGLVTELSKTEEFVGYLNTLYQLENAENIEDPDLIMLGANYGKDPNVGRATQVTVHVYRYSRPENGSVHTVPAGTAVSTDDGRFVYTALNDAQMDGNFADIYYNSEDQWYEIPVLVEAVAVGSDYDLPPGTITRLLSAVESFDGVINRDDPRRQGSDPVDPVQFVRQLHDTIQGVNFDSAGNIINTIQDLDPTGYDDIAFVSSMDTDVFKRNKTLGGSLGYDIYLISDSVTETQQEGIASGGETEISLEQRPVLSVAFVTVNSIPVSFSFEPDTNSPVRGSPRANDKVKLDVPLLPLQTYQITYVYYDLISQANDVFQGRAGIFGADMLVRLANPVEVLIEVEISVSSTADREEAISDLRSFTERFLRNPDSLDASTRRFIESLDPSSYADAAAAFVEGITNVKINTFIRVDRASMDVELITFDGGTEYPILSPNFSVS